MTAGFTARLSAEVERDLRELSVRYAGACDRGDESGFRELFSQAAAVVLHLAGADEPATIRGVDSIAGIPQALTKYAKTFHVLGQSAYADGEMQDHATGEVYCVAHHLSQESPVTDKIMHVRYFDEYVRDEHGWRITRREVFVDFITTVQVS